MEVVLIKKQNKNQLIFTRQDGSVEVANIGPSLPHHDLAHFVVETNVNLKNGFFDNVAKGYSVRELGDKEIIKKLGHETWVAEICARALQSLYSGACEIEQFETLIKSELNSIGIPLKREIPKDLSESMLSQFQNLVVDFENTNEGSNLKLLYESH